MSSVNLINSGLDVLAIVDNLIAAERAPITRLQAQSSLYEDRIAAYQAFNTKLLAFKTRVESILYSGDTVPLNIPADFSDRFSQSLFALRKATSSDESIATAIADKGMAAGSFTLAVSGLATFNSHASNNFTDTSTTIKTGPLILQKGSEDPVTIVIDETNNTLQGLKNAINAADAGITASIVNDGSGAPFRLMLTSNDSGSAGAIVITNNLDQGDGSGITFSETVAAADATFLVSGITVTSSTNRVTNAVEGVTFDLKSVGAAVITLERDIDSIVAGIVDFAAKYTDVASYISSQTRYDAVKKSAGLLSGDYLLRRTQSELASAISHSIDSDGASRTVLAQVGITVGRDGSLTVDEAKLRSALSSHFMDTAHLFLADATGAGGNTISIVPRLQSRLRSITDSYDGPVLHATNAIQQNVSRIAQQIQQMEARLEVRREILLAQFNRADEALRQLNIMQSAFTSQLNVLSSLE